MLWQLSCRTNGQVSLRKSKREWLFYLQFSQRKRVAYFVVTQKTTRYLQVLKKLEYFPKIATYLQRENDFENPSFHDFLSLRNWTKRTNN
jgi:hypothetical protein